MEEINGKPVVDDDMTPHLLVVRDELAATVHDMEQISATSAAAAHYQALQRCERMLTTPADPEIQPVTELMSYPL